MRCCALGLVVVLLLAGACRHGPTPQRLARAKIRLGETVLEVEVAQTRRERALGMKFRTRLGEDEGMLFVFPDEAERAFHMKDTFVPLSIAFLRADGGIVRLAEMAPQTTALTRSGVPCRYALEMPAGWFEANGIREGMRVEISHPLPGGPPE